MTKYIADVWVGDPSPRGFGVSDIFPEADNPLDAAKAALEHAKKIIPSNVTLSNGELTVSVREL